jgi:GT2 family glycosyltransferase
VVFSFGAAFFVYRRAVIDVVIPAYRGFEETRRCVESVLAARCETRHELTVIDDASPEQALSTWLREQAAAGRITLKTHQANRGFVACANEAFQLHGDRNVVLLNSDTEVANGWLDRLAAHGTRDPSVGTATPFSTNATICSYPRTLANNALPHGETTESLDAAFARANPGGSADIPTAVGFCMWISRNCLERTGPFDQARYGLGYGEEVDFCMRAARAGFRHVVAADVFVRHAGEVSFGGGGADRRARAQAIVDGLYPEFQQRLAAFIPADPLRMLRRRADLERLRRSPGELRVAPSPGRALRLDWPRCGEEFCLWLHPQRDREGLAAIRDALAGTGPLPQLDPDWLRPLA